MNGFELRDAYDTAQSSLRLLLAISAASLAITLLVSKLDPYFRHWLNSGVSKRDAAGKRGEGQ